MQILDTLITLDVIDWDKTPAKIKTIQLDSQTRYVDAIIQDKGVTYDIGENATVTLTVIRPDKTGVQITGQTKAHVESSPMGEAVTTYGAYAEFTPAALAVKGKLDAQFMITSGGQVLRTEIFTVTNGEALDASTSEWAEEYQGYNLDELVQSVNESSAKVDAMEDDVSDLKEGLSELQEGGYIADAQQIQEKINNYLDQHPEATTTVQDGSIGYSKFDVSVSKDVNFFKSKYIFATELSTGDNSAYINGLIANAPDGSVIVLPSFSAIHYANIVISRNNITLSGAFNLSTQSDLRAYNGNEPCIKITGRNVCIRNLGIYAKATNNNVCGILVDGGRDVYINNVNVNYFQENIKITEASTCVFLSDIICSYATAYNINNASPSTIISNASMYQSATYGGKILKTSNSLKIANAWIQSYNQHGLELVDEGRIQMSNVSIDSNNADDILCTMENSNNYLMGAFVLDGYITNKDGINYKIHNKSSWYGNYDSGDQIDGNMIFRSGSPVIKSSNGTLFKIVVSNDGTLSAESAL